MNIFGLKEMGCLGEKGAQIVVKQGVQPGP